MFDVHGDGDGGGGGEKQSICAGGSQHEFVIKYLNLRNNGASLVWASMVGTAAAKYILELEASTPAVGGTSSDPRIELHGPDPKTRQSCPTRGRNSDRGGTIARSSPENA